MSLPTLARPRTVSRSNTARSVLLACPDARPPAYQAAVGLARAGVLAEFLTSYYYRDDGPFSRIARRAAPARFARVEHRLKRRHEPAIPQRSVRSVPSFDVALQLEGLWPSGRHALARWRTDHFDRLLARALRRERPSTLFVFSDVGSEHALPTCRELGIASILSMVHGDVREEAAILEREAERSPDFFPIYLADGPIDRRELDWLHGRRLRDIAQADRILVPSQHIADTLAHHGTPRERIAVVPYAADTNRFRPDPDKQHSGDCTFLFAGGITQRKGIKYLLQAWRLVRRPGWRLQLLGGLPRDPRPLEPYLDGVELLGRVGHSDVPARMAAADVFVFPSLFEGSAVVTYEALACGLPSVVTTESGSVARDGREGLLVPAADVEALADRMRRLGLDPELRAEMAAAARARAEEFDWSRYHEALLDVTAGLPSE